ncbi:hypothetical protein [Noviherbaspirillum aerium]|uniref:hypothetical protein n=1 Tax=Noviherbaspirillum aerium TaxID=2588497 RepID=UPI00124BE2EB|nr:hypothetical protein [Noviherbaspirillum aerium]
MISAIDARLIALLVGQYYDYGPNNYLGTLRSIRNSVVGLCDLTAYHARLDGDQMLMNRQTGSVDTRANWLAEAPAWDVDIAEDVLIQFNELLMPLVLSPEGPYIEADGAK